MAVRTLRDAGCRDLIILKCTTAYPTPFNEVNLQTIPHMAEMFDCWVGLSDHTIGIGVPVAAFALGAKVIEKHFVLAKEENSVDAFFSLVPSEFKEMVDEIRKVEKALGKVNYDITSNAQKNLLARRSLYISKNMKFFKLSEISQIFLVPTPRNPNMANESAHKCPHPG